MIMCPVCGAKTAVTETRVLRAGSRRRRRCTVVGCAGRLTTVELVVNEPRTAQALAEGSSVLVSAQLLTKLREIITMLGGDAT